MTVGVAAGDWRDFTSWSHIARADAVLDWECHCRKHDLDSVTPGPGPVGFLDLSRPGASMPCSTPRRKQDGRALLDQLGRDNA